MLDDLKNNHGIHGLAIGAVVYYLMRNNKNALPISVGVGAGAYWWMSKHGHGLPFSSEKPEQ